jgi:hypothetical protein
MKKTERLDDQFKTPLVDVPTSIVVLDEGVDIEVNDFSGSGLFGCITR